LRLEHLIAWIAQEPWAIETAKAHEIIAYLAERAAGDAAQKMSAPRERAVRQQGGRVALIPLIGVMAQRSLPGDSTGTSVSTDETGRLIDRAAADSSIKAIVLDIDSPGGSVSGTRELAAKVRTARDVKPVIAQVDSIAASAAYWVASQATEVVSTPGGITGSIGVLAIHEDLSAALEKEGIKHTIISAGKHKAEGSPFEPLSDETRAHYQERVDESYRDFVADVAAGRGVSPKMVEADYGQGRVLSSERALAAGMIDRIATFDETLARFAAPQPNTQRRARAARARART